MRKILNTFFLLTVILALDSCRSKKPVVNPPLNQSAEAYINAYKDIAISEMRRTGVPASITLAQGMVESNNGLSRLAREGNNHFGIKCHNGWTGATIIHDDDRRNECFRRYRSAQDSYYDHSDFLRTGSRYSFLFSLSPYDYKAWAHGLKKAGYATNPDYAAMLIRKIEQYNLSMYDRAHTAGAGSPVVPPARPAASLPATGPAKAGPEPAVTPEFVVSRAPRVRENNRIQYIIVRESDTRESIEKELGLLRWELPRYNELGNDFIPAAGQMLYLQPKRDKADAGQNTYRTVEGDTMYMIAQKYGIKLRSLLEMNRMNTGEEPSPGTVIYLRSVKPVK